MTVLRQSRHTRTFFRSSLTFFSAGCGPSTASIDKSCSTGGTSTTTPYSRFSPCPSPSICCSYVKKVEHRSRRTSFEGACAPFGSVALAAWSGSRVVGGVGGRKQTTLPHSRQWCRRTRTPKAALQSEPQDQTWRPKLRTRVSTHVQIAQCVASLSGCHLTMLCSAAKQSRRKTSSANLTSLDRTAQRPPLSTSVSTWVTALRHNSLAERVRIVSPSVTMPEKVEEDLRPASGRTGGA